MNSENDRKGKHMRSIRLTTDMVERLNAVCDHLGVTPNAYINLAIGKAVSHDEITYKAQQNQADTMGQMMTAFQTALMSMVEQEPENIEGSEESKGK